MSADNSHRLIVSHIMAKLMLLLHFSSSEICVLLDLKRTENAGWSFSSVNKFLFGDLEEELRGIERFIEARNNE